MGHRDAEKAAKAAKNLGVKVVNGFTGSPIWHLLYSFPPCTPNQIANGYKEFAKTWKPILDVYAENGIKFALEVHPTEIAFDIASAERAIEALDGHPAFGFNFDPSHLGYQGVNSVPWRTLQQQKQASQNKQQGRHCGGYAPQRENYKTHGVLRFAKAILFWGCRPRPP